MATEKILKKEFLELNYEEFTCASFLQIQKRVPYTFCVKRDWGYFFP